MQPSDFETSEYDFQFGLSQINASSAYAQGATGEGVLVAVIDTDVDASHPDLEGQVSSASIDLFAASRPDDDIDTGGHGTFVAGIIAAKRDGSGVHGVAYESEILALRADDVGSCAEVDECLFSDSAIIDAIEYAVDQGAKVINLSLGKDPDPDPQLENAVYAAAEAGVLVVVSAGNEADPNPTDDDGNPLPGGPTGTSPNEPGNLAGQTRSLGRVVSVGAIGPNGQISDFSNRAADTQDFYILAPGDFGQVNGDTVGVIAPGPDDDVLTPGEPGNDSDSIGDYWFVSGTSFAAPHVSGGLALLLDAFPTLAPEDALQILLDTATDYVDASPDAILGIAAGEGVDSVSGVGIMNLEAAFQPVGATSMRVNGSEILPASLFLADGGALGDWATASGAFEGLFITDSYDRAFQLESLPSPSGGAALASLEARARNDQSQHGQVSYGDASFSWTQRDPVFDPAAPYEEDTEAQFKMGFSAGKFGFETGRGAAADSIAPRTSLVFDPAAGQDGIGGADSWFKVTRDVGAFTADFYAENDRARDAFGLGFSTSGTNWVARAELGAETDDSGALGGRLQSRFGGESDSYTASTFQLEAARDLPGGWKLSASAETTSARFDGIDVDGLWTSAWSIGLTAPNYGKPSSWAIVLAQPRRAEAGRLTFTGATGVDGAGALIFSERTASLTPSGREIDLEARWSRRFGPVTELETAAALVSQGGHIADEDLAGVFWLRLNTKW